MLRLLAVASLLCPLTPAFAQTPTADLPWEQDYDFPLNYCIRTFNIEHEKPALLAEQLVRSRGTKDRKSDASHEIVRWEMLSENAGDETAALQSLGKLAHYARNCDPDPAPEYPELARMRDILQNEGEAHSALAARIPSIRGVVEARIDDLDRYVAAEKHARMFEGIVVVIRTQWDEDKAAREPSHSRTPLHVAVKMAKRRLPPVPVNGTDPESGRWVRASHPVCMLVPTVYAAVTALGDAEDRLNALMQNGGEHYTDDGCRRRGEGWWVDEQALPLIRERLTRDFELRKWKEAGAAKRTTDIPDDEKFAGLSRDLKKAGEGLVDAPNMRAVAADELKRLRPYADNLSRARERRLLFVEAIE